MSYIILDRDGVINYESEAFIKSPDEWIPIPDSLEAIARLNNNGFRVLLLTNQSGIARGYFDINMLNLIHDKLRRELAAVGGTIEEIVFCPHHPDQHCDCRKPKAGMIRDMQKKYGFDCAKTFAIGDSWRDIKAAENGGCLPILVLTGNGSATLQQYPEMSAIPHFSNLARAVDYVLFTG